ncbi:MAG TPA: imidazole glycerol phosphate synthase subunit HisF [Bacillus bacterium]|uniref:Imidazole glycerol phosphate synthase subunit HisF n=1 Tax=Siminovitchia fordii TaxID=254759 RepID=A0ABQ4KAG6_9BACI|nr:imidazole glycerol phosphate synthase subunit HisF [Siminovitchia fordii]GIN22711.1 imidazole glycerol phosphate synthase subunit hisF1 [Siminovitchia fordii]HBZ10734.1 imidazole glycerol phosphate synthase subunit HisF [Bacillus sp. (in: firmicutes)]
MLKKRIIPAIDVTNDQAVKYVQFRNPTVIGDPAELGRNYAEQGADEILYLDTTASLHSQDVKYEWIRRVAEELYIPFSVVGGIRTIDDFKRVLRAGADKVGVNTAAVKKPELLTEAANIFGSQCVVLALDAKPIKDDDGEIIRWEVYTHSAHESSGMDAIEWACRAEELGAGEIVCTSIDRDGMKNGYDIELLRSLTKTVNIPIIASGGAGNMAHILEAFKDGLVDAALVASLLHYGELTVMDIKKYLSQHDVPIRYHSI